VTKFPVVSLMKHAVQRTDKGSVKYGFDVERKKKMVGEDSHDFGLSMKDEPIIKGYILGMKLSDRFHRLRDQHSTICCVDP